MPGSVSLIDGHMDEVKTNYDNIREMSVEEMATFLMDFFTDCMTGNAPMNVQKWLESEVTHNA